MKWSPLNVLVTFAFWLLVVERQAWGSKFTKRTETQSTIVIRDRARGQSGVARGAERVRRFEPKGIGVLRAACGGVLARATDGVVQWCGVNGLRRIALVTAHAVSLSGGGPWSFMAKNMAVTGKRCPPPVTFNDIGTLAHEVQERVDNQAAAKLPPSCV